MITHARLGLNGRFGNQLFQFASTIGIGRKLGLDVVFPSQNLVSRQRQRLNNNHEFNAKIDIVDCFEIGNNFFSNNIQVKHQVNEGTFHFNPTLFRVPDQSNIDGYLQSEKYFEHCSDEIKEILRIQPHFLELARNLMPEIDKNITGIHVRRGDYITSNNNHPFVGIDYIKRAMAEFDGEETHFIVVSDDYKWCEENLSDIDNLTIINSKSMFIDFTILTLCDDLVISNSSFSWWASYLNGKPNNKIIAPKNWFGGSLSNLNTNDLYRKEMTLL
jgi:hypothetical protein